jgi:TDG/mug DNA glycosylase family protein
VVETLRGLTPIVSPLSRILILGSFPGEESLRKQEYYAHERNGFWKILTALYEPGRELKTYASKKAFIKKYRLAVWDVIHSCERKTSADSRIKNPIPNDFAAFFARHPEIKKILLNGARLKKRQTWPRFGAGPKKVPEGTCSTAVYVPPQVPPASHMAGQSRPVAAGASQGSRPPNTGHLFSKIFSSQRKPPQNSGRCEARSHGVHTPQRAGHRSGTIEVWLKLFFTHKEDSMTRFNAGDFRLMLAAVLLWSFAVVCLSDVTLLSIPR